MNRKFRLEGHLVRDQSGIIDKGVYAGGVGQLARLVSILNEQQTEIKRLDKACDELEATVEAFDTDLPMFSDPEGNECNLNERLDEVIRLAKL